MDLSNKTLAELRTLAREYSVKGVTGLRKTELLKKLEQELGADGPEKAGGTPRNKSSRGEQNSERQDTRDVPVSSKIDYGKNAAAQKTGQPDQAGKTDSHTARRKTDNSSKRGGNPSSQQTKKKPAGQTAQKKQSPQIQPYAFRQEAPKPEQAKRGENGSWPRRTVRGAEQPANASRTAPVNSQQHGAQTEARTTPYVSQHTETHAAQNQAYTSSVSQGGYYNQMKQRYRDGSDGIISIVKDRQVSDVSTTELKDLDSGITKKGILEIMPEGYGFIRCDNFLPGENDVYVAPQFIKRFGLRTGDIVEGNERSQTSNEKFCALLYMKSVNGRSPSYLYTREKFEELTPIFPDSRIHLETPGAGISMRMLDLISPIGKGQRGMIVSQPKTGKTTLLKQVAKAVTRNYPKMHLIVLLIDERPEEVTDIKESIEGEQVEVIYSTFDELPENHKRVSEMVIERAKRLVEGGDDVMILLDSITRLARAYNLTVTPSGRTLSGGLDPAALHMPKRFFGAARNMREGGSLTILATALVDTGSRMDDVVFEEFKGTGNMELVLDRSLSEKRIFPAIDIQKSSTRREDLLLNPVELEAVLKIRKALGGLKSDQALEQVLNMFRRTKDNAEFLETVKKMHL